MNSEQIIESINRTLSIESEAIASLTEKVDSKVLLQVVDKIKNCQGKIIVTACGTSGVAAKKIVHSLSCISIPAVYLTPSDAVHGALGIVTEKDIVIFISKGGNTTELTNFIENVKAKKAYIIGVTENKESKIAKNSDAVLLVKTDKEPDEFNMLATASTLSVIALFDGIIIALMTLTEFNKKEFLTNHPAGAVGQKLSQ